MAFQRVYKLVVTPYEKGKDAKDVDSLVVENLHVEFDVTKTSDSKNNTAEIRIFNLAEKSLGFFDSKDAVISLYAGYKDEHLSEPPLIFRGTKSTCITRKQGSDQITTVVCADGGVIVREGRVNKTFPKDASLKSVIQGVVKAGMPEIETLNYSDKIPEKLFRSGWSWVGSARAAMDELCSGHRLEWHIVDQYTLNVYQLANASKDQKTAVFLTPQTGLIDYPESTNQEIKDLKKDLKVSPDKGVKLRSVLNAAIRVDGYIKLQGTKNLDGVYKVEKLNHRGSYEGGDWITEAEGVLQKETSTK